MKTISVCAKCVDMFTATLKEDGKGIGEYDGYVPSWFPSPSSDNDGDYVILNIDVNTGQILNWKKPTEKQLRDTFKLGTPAKVQKPPVTDIQELLNERIRAGQFRLKVG